MSEQTTNEVQTGEAPARVYHEIESKYEFVVAAAREAERLNEFYRNRAIQPDEKVTMEAIRRVRESRTQITYEAAIPQEEEPRKEATYFFGA